MKRNRKQLSVLLALIMLMSLLPMTAAAAEDGVCTVRFDSAGGSAVEAQEVTAGEPAAEPAEPMREGYVFSGWFTEEEEAFDFDTPVSEDMTLTARWTEKAPEPTPEPTPEPEFTVQAALRQGDPEKGPGDPVYNVALDDMWNGTVTRDRETAAEGETVTLTPAPAEGYVLDTLRVYDLTAHADLPTTKSGESYTFIMPASDVMVMAEFKEDAGYSLKGLTAAGTGYSTSMGRWWPDFGDSIACVWDGAAPEDSAYSIASSSFFLDAGETQHLTTEPDPGQTYYFHIIVYNQTRDDHSIDFSQAAASAVSVTLDGFAVQLLGTEARLINQSYDPATHTTHGYDGIYLYFSAKKDGEAPAESYDLWVGGVRVTSENKDDIPGFDTGTASFDPAANTLTLNGVSGAKGTMTTGNDFSAVILNKLTAPLNLKGTGSIITDGNVKVIYGGDLVMDPAIDLTLQGSYGIEAKSLSVSGGSLTVAGGPNIAIDCDTINISGGTVTTLSGLSYSVYGIRADDELNITGGTVDATGGTNGIWSYGTVNISGAATVVKAKSLYGTDELNSAICALGLNISAPLEIVAPEGGEARKNSHDYYSIYDGDTVAKEVEIKAPATVTEYPVWLGETQVTSENKDDILGDGKASFDAETNTLTLNDPGISGYHDDSKIYAEGIDLTIEGSATINGDDCGIEVRDGSLTLDGDFTISGTVDAIAADKISITGGTVTATGTEGTGIHAAGSISITGGTVDATGDTSAIWADGGISIAETHEITFPAGGHLSESAKTIFGGDGVRASHAVIEPKTASYTVTYKVVNGTWADGTTADKTETVADGATPAAVPTGMIAASGFAGGAWDTDPGTVTISADRTFTYSFEAITPVTHTVTFKSNGVTIGLQTVNDGDTATKPANPKRSGFHFGGWFTNAACTGSAYNFSTPVTGDITLYAKWMEIKPVTPLSYKITKGADGYWVRGSVWSYEIIVKRSVDDDTCYSHFRDVQIDGVTLKYYDDYYAASGSTEIRFLPSYLQKLDYGVHKVTILFDDGSVSTTLSIRKGVATGDDSQPAIWAALALMSGLGVFTAADLLRRRRRMNRH